MNLASCSAMPIGASTTDCQYAAGQIYQYRFCVGRRQNVSISVSIGPVVLDAGKLSTSVLSAAYAAYYATQNKGGISACIPT